MHALALAALVAAAASPETIVVQGTPVPVRFDAGGKTLLHNGSGVRKKFVVKVYVGTLYLERTGRKDADEIIRADETKAVRLVFMRDVSKNQVFDAFREGFHNNSPGEAAALGKKLDEVAKAIPAELKEHQVLVFVYEPGKGTTIGVEGGPPPVTVEGKEFNDALLRNWIGPKPADDGLKRRMLAG